MEFFGNRSALFFALILVFQSLLARNVESIFEKAPCCGRGPAGRDGRDGRDASLLGPQGEKGERGPAGAPGAPGSSSVSTGGVVYTRWGRTVCPTTSETDLLYAGVMGGSHYSHPGGGANYLCLPNNPIYDKVKAGNQGAAYIYGVEYETNLMSNIFPTNVHDSEAPCAVCHAESRGSHVMIPARNVCPSGWTMEYKGYLMTEHYNHKGRTQYICVDGDPEGVPGTQANLNGALLYPVESHCGSLPCLPYIQGHELTCVVCTK